MNTSVRYFTEQLVSNDVWYEVNERGHDTFEAAYEEYRKISKQQPDNDYRVTVVVTTKVETQIMRNKP